MDIGSVRPVISGMNAPVPRAPAAADQAASTDLPVGSAVARSDETAYAGNDRRGGSDQSNVYSLNLRSTVTVDEDADMIVYRRIDETTGDVIDQIPDESRLRMRAMINAWTEAMHGSTGSASTLV
ncbi:conserved hypothetical protein [uncultured Pleomorphomonas sp.]|uniref:Flagellar protein FlaG n=2 Tax=Pleomorphomonas TaxID=261933 RepID=A0A2G9X1G4_9HYPH|nr:flagellar protein FlaG [Pleomorphomonas carboxyditropha]PIP00780.1 hypothetical protein CJ014_01355 [Pleomorphomonas carboxyditropha]SCM72645.1 conserved hypothetical protein [uncultured Pleomorphomonas sp.]